VTEESKSSKELKESLDVSEIEEPLETSMEIKDMLKPVEQ